jgi:DNA-binding beta-propeller fold protein YncE
MVLLAMGAAASVLACAPVPHMRLPATNSGLEPPAALGHVGVGGDEAYARAQEVLTAKCSSCHGAEKAEAGLRLDSWEHIMAGSRYGEAVIAFDPDNSLMIELATKLKGGAHPGEVEGDTLSVEEVDAIRTWIADGARNGDGNVAFADARNLVYACNQGEAVVSVIDADANVVIRNIDLKKLGYGPNAKPHHVAVEPGGEHWFVSLIGENRVLKFNRANELVGEAEFEVPGMLAYDANRDVLYVGRSMSAVNPPQSIGVINPGDMSADEIDVFVPRPHALAVSLTGDYVYTASLAQNTIVALDAETYEATLTDLGGRVHTLVQFARSPDGSSLSAGGQLSGTFIRFDATAPPAVTVSDSLSLGGMPWHPVFGPDGLLFVPNKGMNSVAVVEVSLPEVVTVIRGKGLAQPHGSAVSSDGRHVYVSNNNMNMSYVPRHDLGDNHMSGTVVVIDTAARQIVKVLEVENGTTGVGAVPAG